MKSKIKPNPHTVVEPLSVTLSNGKTITGKLWLHPSRLGSFEVEYNETRKSDGRTDYKSEQHIRSIAEIILREMAEANR